MRTGPLVALGIVAYALFLFALMPARFVAQEVASRMGDRLRVHEASGTVWHGAARIEIAASPSWIAVDNLAWRWRPAGLLRRRLAFSVDAQALGGNAQLVVARDFSDWNVSGHASAPASVAGVFMPLLSTWRPEGNVDVRSDGIAWNGREARGDAVAEWRDAAVALSPVRPLGSYRATLHAEGAAGKAAIATIAGPLRIEGQGDVAFPSRFAFQGEARGEGAQASALDPLLDLMGPKRPDGARTLAWRSN